MLKMNTQEYDKKASLHRKIASAQKQIEEWNVTIVELLKEQDNVEGRKEVMQGLFQKEIDLLNVKMQQYHTELGTKAEKTNNFKISL